ncbi:MAG TPA: alginate lyase family protein [Streptosporangiaceae bacterium]
MGTGDLARLGRTVVHLQPGQLSHRARLRAQRLALHRVPLTRRWLLSGPPPQGGPGWPAGFHPLDARVWRGWAGTAALEQGEITLLGQTRRLVPETADGDGADGTRWLEADWLQGGAALLWRFHLAYWDWAWALATERKQSYARPLFATLWNSWHSAITPGSGTAWRPYPAALRAWSFCGVHAALVAGSGLEEPFRADLAAHAGFLRRNLETDVGGNHLLKNLKALIGLAVFFADDALLDQTVNRLIRQLDVQVLPDGGHFERAPAYHAQVLADLIDVAGLLRAAGHNEPTELPKTIGAMRRWLGTVLTPAGDVPLLNDGFPVEHNLLAGLHLPGPTDAPLAELPDSGLVRASVGSWQLLADGGLPCPDELPAHAHADTLGCLVWVDREPLLVDTGTSAYAAGPVRAYERSTAAHNTAEIDGADSTEVWGAFRAGRRARVRGLASDYEDGTVVIEAVHDGYRHLRGRPGHRRRWTLTGDLLQVDDDIEGHGRHKVAVRWHLAPGSRMRLIPGGATVTTPAGEFQVNVSATSEPALVAGTAAVATGFGRTTPAPVLTCTVQTTLPVHLRTTWRHANRRENS